MLDRAHRIAPVYFLLTALTALTALTVPACTKPEPPAGTTSSASTGTTSAPVASVSAAPTASAAPTETAAASASAATTASAATSASAATTPSASAAGSVAPKASSSAAAAGDTAPACGKKPLPDCPLQAWMKANTNPAISSNDLPALATALDKTATFAPAGYGNWASIAKDGAKAAKAGDMIAAKASCRTCHDQYKNKYKAELRARKI